MTTFLIHYTECIRPYNIKMATENLFLIAYSSKVIIVIENPKHPYKSKVPIPATNHNVIMFLS